MLFDWAAQPFFTVVTTFIFGPYFVARLTADPVSAQAMWSNMATISSVIIAVLSPILGSIADQSGARKAVDRLLRRHQDRQPFRLWFAAPGSP
jgi:UMF1 family MFS transporter